ncbi:MAG TPA: nitroreductase family protein [Methanothermobacter sp.]|jgi:nitroreductase|uniref:NADH dehydrogenase n=1 Tax=Methanothermobacter tenebrarum TaxID=680118 RepID=A0ABM7YE18_9EURY|nr:nitroreductase family protein [Methanothermobacter tenebrarum]MDI6881276.1 nitroreductase family protein [Methanothermobacter sp.]MDX9693189.1 nitroreductase family protein [Methanothermobacter sp.]BDH79551.1 NADH dehydrogenase [Methanothermobacter tenebrarum]HHW15815.1 nitroreductase family protein [Methanothermobacter sp.]HOQ19976.1 nitroreductase family protein [Methanothermobacter sp.]
MSLLDVIKGRRSIRRFKKRDIPREYLEKIMEAARWAPSAGNLQSRKFLIVKNPQLKNEIANAAYRQSFIAEAPVVIVACADLERSALGYGERGRNLYCLFDVAAAVENMLLTIHELGLGACWVGAFDERLVSEILDIPSTLRPVTIVPLGYPAEKPSPPPRMSLEEAFNIID